jgi:hypothetical protein
VNTFLDVETLSMLQKAGLIDTQQVYYLSKDEIIDYMAALETQMAGGGNEKLLNIKLHDGINYITSLNRISLHNTTTAINPYTKAIKHHVICVNNSTNIAGDGWLGLDSTYLTQDSFGNTLMEMNAVQQ